MYDSAHGLLGQVKNSSEAGNGNTLQSPGEYELVA